MKRKNKKAILKIILALIFIFLFALFYLVWNSEPFLIKEIIVTTDYDIKTNPALERVLEKRRKENIFWLNNQALSQEIKATDLKIDQVLVQKRFPGKILVEIKSRQALAVIPVGNKFFFVDKEGLVFSEKNEPPTLPILELGLQNISLGSRIDNRYKSIFLILEALKGKNEVRRMVEVGEELKIETEGETLILFPLQDEVEAKVNALQTILDRFRIEGKRPSKIDLRFEKPIVTF